MAVSDLVDNALRGALAEYIVACDLGVANGTRPGWNAYDLKTPEGIKVEVKSAAYLQSWQQSAHSKVCFDIRPTYGWDAETNTTVPRGSAKPTCMCSAYWRTRTRRRSIRWTSPSGNSTTSRVLDEKLPTQKTINLAGLLRLGPVKMEFGGIRNTIKDLFR